MTEEQEQHLKDLIDSFKQLARPKYEAGAIEHGGSIFDLSIETLIHELKSELLDAWVYLDTLERKLTTSYEKSEINKPGK